MNLWDLPQKAHIEMDGRTRVRKIAPLPVRLPLGYHEITVEAAGATANVRYTVTPDRAWMPPHLGRGGRTAGIAVSLYGVRSARNWGCGDFTDLLQVVDFAADQLECGFVALNPLHAIHNRRPFNTSPYLPNCIFYQNFLYLDVEGMEDFAHCRRAQQLRNTPEVNAEIVALRDAQFVEYERVSALKLRFPQAAVRAVSARAARRVRTRPPFSGIPGSRGRPARKIRDLLRARRAHPPSRIPTPGSGRTGRRHIRIRTRPKRSPSGRNTGAA